MVNECPKCQTKNPEDSKFCKECGTSFTDSDQPIPTKTLETPIEELTTGSTFANRYQIIEELGKGGMGRIYRVLDKELNEEIALKLIKPDIASDKKTVERFKNELKLARKISQKNVGKMYELLDDKGTKFITMEYVSGGDLKKFIRRSKRLDTGTAVSIAKQICEGLSEAHSMGIVHRDLKPNNIMIDDHGNARIMDFGIARTVKEKAITGSGVMIGTPEYMSPEQAEAKDVDQRSDIYSLGIILYEMVTGKLPFDGETPLALAMKHKGEMATDPREFNPQIPDDLSGVVLKCLEKEKGERYQNAEQVKAELEKIEQGLPTTDRVVAERKTVTSKEITVAFGLRKFFLPALVILVLVIIAIVIWQLLPPKEEASTFQEKPSIAVLPFDDRSPQKNQGYLCDGLSESIINALSKVEGLRVPARSSSFSFKGKDNYIKEIGEKLSIKTLLEGSLQKAENRIRITAQLINVADESVLWSDQYDREEEHIFDIQDKITLAIVDTLKVKLLGKEKVRITKRYTGNQEAYNFYLMGRNFSNKHTEAGYKKGIEYFEKAIHLDQTYALAYVGLAHCYKELSRLSLLPHSEGYPKAKEALMKALGLDDTLGEAHAILGSIKFIYEWDMSGPEYYFQRAIKLSPGSADVYVLYSQYLMWVDKADESIAMAKKAVSLDPLSPMTSSWLAVIYFYANRYDESIEQEKKLLGLDPNFVWAHIYLCHNYTMKGINAKALVHLDKVESISLALSDHSLLCWVGNDYARAGRRDKAQELLVKALELYETKSIDVMAIVLIYSALGEKDKAFEWLTKAVEEHSSIVVYLKVYGRTLLKNLRSDPRYNELLKRVGFEK